MYKHKKSNILKKIWSLYISQRYFIKIILISILPFFIIFLFFTHNKQIYYPHVTVTTHLSSVLPPTVFAFYYDWYGALPYTSSYIHWDGGGNFNAPNNIFSDFYPTLGAYSSNDPAVIATHMKWLKEAKVDVVVLSWWGQGNYTDINAAKILNAAARNGLKVSFMIEPYANRTLQSMIADIKYIYRKYGDYPAFYRAIRPTLYGHTSTPRGVFFLYDLSGGTDTVQRIDALRGTSNDGIFLARMDDSLLFTNSDVRKQLSYSHVDGFFNYSPFPKTPASSWPHSNDYMLVISVLPGWDHSKISGQANNFQSRENGAYYDRNWKTLIQQKVEGVSILSFNEWHEGGQIEPSVPHSYNGFAYKNYEGAYGLSGMNASMAYIEKTAYWVSQYKQITPALYLPK